MLVPFLVSKYNHFIIKYDFPQHWLGLFDFFLLVTNIVSTYFLNVFLDGIQHKILLRLEDTWGEVIEVIAKKVAKKEEQENKYKETK